MPSPTPWLPITHAEKLSLGRARQYPWCDGVQTGRRKVSHSFHNGERAESLEIRIFESSFTMHLTSRNHQKFVQACFAFAICIGLAACSDNDLASTSPITPTKAFPGADGCADNSFVSDVFALGTIHSQHGWFSDPSAGFDQEIVNLGGQAKRGKGVWKISNTVKSGGFGNQPQSPELSPTAGESTVRSAGGGDTSCTSFYIRTVASAADGSAFTFSHSPPALLTDRHEYVRFENDDDTRKGFRVWGLDTVGSTADFTGRNFDSQTLMPRATWKQIVVITTSPDGPANDVVKIYVDGILKTTMSTWEDWRYANFILPGNIPPAFAPPSMSRGMFRLSTTGTDMNAAYTAPQGFYIDDFVQVTYNAASPSLILSQYKTGFELP